MTDVEMLCHFADQAHGHLDFLRSWMHNLDFLKLMTCLLFQFVWLHVLFTCPAHEGKADWAPCLTAPKILLAKEPPITLTSLFEYT